MPGSVLRGVVGFAVGLAAMGLARAAAADELTAFGAGAESISLAGGGSALVQDASAVYTCPASMAFGPPSVSLSFHGAINRLHTRLSPRPPGYDAPDLGGNSPVVPYRYRLEPRQDSRAPGFVGFAVGGTTSLGIDWLRVGVLAFIPLSGLGRQYTYFADEREQYFSNSLHYETYGEQLNSQQTLLAVSVRPLRWLAVAGGMRMSFDARSNSDVIVPNSEDRSLQYMDLRAETHINVSTVAAVMARVLDQRLRFALTFRDQAVSSIEGINHVQVKGFEGTNQFPLNQPMRFNVEVVPRQFAFGVGWRDRHFAASGDFTIQQWSQYRGNHDEAAGFHDTLVTAIGGGIAMTRGLWLRGGVGYRPSPVPPQTGRTNYVDNDMWILGLGASQTLKIDGNELEVAVFSQLQLATPRQDIKQRLAQHPSCQSNTNAVCDEVPDTTQLPGTNTPAPQAAGLQTGNPGFPGYSSGGWVTVGGVELTWRYR